MFFFHRIRNFFNPGSPEVSRREAFSTFAFWRTPRRSTSGFVILFAILISVIILLLGFGIFSVATKQSILSSGAREAQYAFTAADTGSECALYAEAQGTIYSATQDMFLDCAENTVTFEYQQPGLFTVEMETGPGTCAFITIETNGNLRTILSQGYNLCNGDQPQTGNPRLAERDLEITYTIPGTVQTPSQGGGTGGTGGGSSGIGTGGTVSSMGSSQLGGNNLGTSPNPGVITGSSQMGTGQVSNQQLGQMQVQTPQDIVIPKLLPPTTVTDTSSPQTMRQVDGSENTSFVKSASQTVTRAAQSVANAVDSAFRAVADLVK